MSKKRSELQQSSILKGSLPLDVVACHELLEQIQVLEERLSAVEEKQGTSSRNASKPPSSDSPEQRSQREPKAKTGRKRGAQPGHPKHERMLLEESAIPEAHRHYHYPDFQCPCGSMRQLRPEPICRHQVFDLPEVQYMVDEHQVFEAVCPCCQRTARGTLPPDVPRGQMGAGLISWITLMNGAYNQSVSSIQQLLKVLWQLDFSTGAISQAARPVSEWLSPLYLQAFDAAYQEPVLHADETRHFRRKDQHWLWVLCSPRIAVFMTHCSRAMLAAKQLLGNFSRILVTD